MTSHLFATFSEASAFAKQVTLEQQSKASVARSTEGFIVSYTIPIIEERHPVNPITSNASKNPESSDADKSVQPTPAPKQAEKHDKSEGQITKNDLVEFKYKLEKLIANEKKIGEENFLNEKKVAEERERLKNERIKQRDAKLKAERVEREKQAGLNERKSKPNENVGKTTENTLPDQSKKGALDICSKCGGSGANGGCTKCDGTGWVKGISEFKKSSSSCATWSINEGIAGTREENKKMRGQLWGDMRNRGRGR